MPIYDYECPRCQVTHEAIHSVAERETIDFRCPTCGKTCKPVITCAGANCANEDADWIRSVTDVVGGDSPEGRAFKQDPTRSNYHAWMRAKGLRPLEPGEAPRKREIGPDHIAMARRLFRERQRRQRIIL